MKSITLAFVLIFSTLAFPNVSQAQSVEELLVQINQLQAQVASIQAQLASVKHSGIVLSRNLFIGVEGEDVVRLQKFLTQTGDYNYGSTTGYYGPVTEAAVRKWQAREGIVKDGTPETTGFGVVGPKTREALIGVRVTKQVERQKELEPEVVEQKEEEVIVQSPDDVLTLPLHVYLLESTYLTVDAKTSENGIRSILNEVNTRFWSQANIVWELQDIRTHLVTNGSDKEYHYATLTNSDTTANNNVSNLTTGITFPAGFVVFVAHSFATIENNGIYFPELGAAVISETNGKQSGVDYMAYLFAHELGHSLNLGHEGDVYNLMHPGKDKNFIARRDRINLLPTQIETARRQARKGFPFRGASSYE